MAMLNLVTEGCCIHYLVSASRLGIPSLESTTRCTMVSAS